jgi:hypothetical protein
VSVIKEMESHQSPVPISTIITPAKILGTVRYDLQIVRLFVLQHFEQNNRPLQALIFLNIIGVILLNSPKGW